MKRITKRRLFSAIVDGVALCSTINIFGWKAAFFLLAYGLWCYYDGISRFLEETRGAVNYGR